MRFFLTRFGLFAFTSLVAIVAAAEPTLVPIAKMKDAELDAVLPSEKAMIIIAFLIQVIYSIAKHWWTQKTKKDEKKNDNTDKNFERVFKMIHDLQTEVKVMKTAPSEDEMFARLQPHIKSSVLEAILKYKDKDRF